MSASILDLTRYFLKLGATGFGGPVALANAMRVDLVDRRGWLERDEYDEGLAIATVCPGPLAYQLAVYCGYITHGIRGALSVAAAFAAAPFAIVSLAAYAYIQFGSTWELRALFFGVAPVVIALIAKSCFDLGKKTLRRDAIAYAFAGAAAAITLALRNELTAIFVVAAAIGAFVFAPAATPPTNPPPPVQKKPAERATAIAIAPIGAAVGIGNAAIFWFFFKTGFFVFGSGLVVVPFLQAYLVDTYHWLSKSAFIDAVAIGIISPGPVVITATFVGYLLNGLGGATAATAGMFAPSILFVILGTPLLRRYRKNRRLQGAIRGITAAVVGVLVGTSILLAQSSIHDYFSASILVATLALLLVKTKRKIPDPALIAAGAITGLLAYALHLTPS